MPEQRREAILVPQAESFGSIAVIRSIGQHGYRVHAASSKKDALGCRSNFCSVSHLSPDYQNPDYYPWLQKLIADNDIKVIIPSEGFLLAIRQHFEKLSHLIPINNDAEIVYGCLSKSHVFNAFLQSTDPAIQQSIPNTLIANDTDTVAWSELAGWQWPLYIKGDGFDGKGHSDSLVKRVENETAAVEIFKTAQQKYNRILIQDHIPGVKATVNLLIQNGELLAESMAIASHENPHQGGLTSLRKSWWQQEMYEDALRRLQFLNWQGPAMVEYKWNHATRQFTFIELNSRYWAALNLDILAGLHFPAIHVDYFLHGEKPDKIQRLKKNIIVRNALPADFGYLLSKLKDSRVPLSAKIKSLIGFCLLPFHPGIKADLFYPGDRKLYFLNFWNFTKELSAAVLTRLRK
ncbi:MAG: hypothetical protein H7A03_03145 [Pseudomonadales bacterium]|nr:hypothetical protein [Pseudomonadales bacterium]